MARQLREKGIRPLLSPESFLVTGMQGPLVEGELERAASWARLLHERVETPRDQHAVIT